MREREREREREVGEREGTNYHLIGKRRLKVLNYATTCTNV